MFSEEFCNISRTLSSAVMYGLYRKAPQYSPMNLYGVIGPVIEAQFIETMVLLTINHQSLIATKANRIVRAAQGRSVMEFGSRRTRDMMEPFMEQELHILADVLEQRVQSQINISGFGTWYYGPQLDSNISDRTGCFPGLCTDIPR